MKGCTAFEKIIKAITQLGLTIEDLKSADIEDVLYRKLTELGLTENQIKLIERYPETDEKFVDNILLSLRSNGIITDVDYPKHIFDKHFQWITKEYQHMDKVTYIYPEEARLLFALTWILKPKQVAFIGSYYGYWAVWWLLANRENPDARATLIDIDPNCCELASRNMQHLALADKCQIVNQNAEEYFGKLDSTECRNQFDWLVLDAEGPKQHSNYDLTDKALYYPLAKTAVPLLSPGGLLICHNILLSHKNDDSYFKNMIINNQRQFYKFNTLLTKEFDQCFIANSTEGVGIYRKMLPLLSQDICEV